MALGEHAINENTNKGEMSQDYPQHRSSGPVKFIVIGLLIFAVLAGTGGYLVYQNWRPLLAGFMQQGIEQIVDSSPMPTEQKQEVKHELTRIVNAFKNSQLSVSQVERLMQNLAPVLELGVPIVAFAVYVEPSGLNQEEKEASHMSLRRLLHGIFEDQIPKSEMEELLDTISTADSTPEASRLKESYTDEELRTFLQAASSLADKHGIPAVILFPDLAGQIRAAVDGVLGAGGFPDRTNVSN